VRPRCSAEFATSSLDGTIRVWSGASYEQLYEFTAPKELCRCLVYHPDDNVLVCGFDNGFVRVFDVPATA
jgi:WD40 repeat protein